VLSDKYGQFIFLFNGSDQIVIKYYFKILLGMRDSSGNRNSGIAVNFVIY
jgi:hypothetical protein